MKKTQDQEKKAEYGYVLMRDGSLSYGYVANGEVLLTEEEAAAFKAVKGL